MCEPSGKTLRLFQRLVCILGYNSLARQRQIIHKELLLVYPKGLQCVFTYYRITQNWAHSETKQGSTLKTDFRFYYQKIFRNCLFCCCFFSITGSQIPRITENPIDTMVPRNDPVTLNCKAEGIPTPTIQWYKDGIPLKILPESHRMILPSGELFFLKVVNTRRESDAGIYWCEAKNEVGISRSRNATLQLASTKSLSINTYCCLYRMNDFF